MIIQNSMIYFQVQFIITFSHSFYTYVSGCDFPLWGQYLLMGYMIIMLILFGNFYMQQYIAKSNARRQHHKKTDSNLHQNGDSTKHVTNGASSHSDEMTNGFRVSNGHSNGSTKRK